jgi:hypothetical protein
MVCVLAMKHEFEVAYYVGGSQPIFDPGIFNFDTECRSWCSICRQLSKHDSNCRGTTNITNHTTTSLGMTSLNGRPYSLLGLLTTCFFLINKTKILKTPNQLRNSTGQSPSCEACRQATDKEIQCLL